jgi:hypothetical protein
MASSSGEDAHHALIVAAHGEARVKYGVQRRTLALPPTSVFCAVAIFRELTNNGPAAFKLPARHGGINGLAEAVRR